MRCLLSVLLVLASFSRLPVHSGEMGTAATIVDGSDIAPTTVTASTVTAANIYQTGAGQAVFEDSVTMKGALGVGGVVTITKTADTGTETTVFTVANSTAYITSRGKVWQGTPQTAPTGNFRGFIVGMKDADLVNDAFIGYKYSDNYWGGMSVPASLTNLKISNKNVTDSYITFLTGGIGAGEYDERMRVTHVGNVGVGSIAPKARVHISSAPTAGQPSLLIDGDAATAFKVGVSSLTLLSSGSLGLNDAAPANVNISVKALNASTTVQVLQAAASQTADTLSIRDSFGTVGFGITPWGCMYTSSYTAGGTLAQGDIVERSASTGTVTAATSSDRPIGVVQNPEGCAANAKCMIGFSGMCYVTLKDSEICDETMFVYSGDVAGRGECADIGTLTRHNGEVGHPWNFIDDDPGAAKKILVQIHFN